VAADAVRAVDREDLEAVGGGGHGAGVEGARAEVVDDDRPVRFDAVAEDFGELTSSSP
jgi:hypothetical protein